MFNWDLPQLPPDGRSDMDNMDIMLNSDNNELMSSDFFDTIRSVETNIQNNYFNDAVDDLNTLSDGSLFDGNFSPNSDTGFQDESIFPARTANSAENTLFDFLETNNNESNNTEVKIQTAPIKINQKPRKIIIQNPINKKFIDKQLINPTTVGKNIGKKIVKVQQLTTSDGKPVVLPYGLKSIKIVNANNLKHDKLQVTPIPAHKIQKAQPQLPQARVQPQPRQRVEKDSNVPSKELTEVKLTLEEKRLLEKEGIKLPAYHPLTKLEDRELKRIRRKIRNKISAQDSRKRKKEYVDGLEERVRRGSEENRNLVQRVKELQKTNKTLMAHIDKLQSLIFKSSSTKATPSTCLMIVMLSILLVSLPNMKLNQMVDNELAASEAEQITTSRTLLSTNPMDDDSFNMEEFFIPNRDEENSENENNTGGFFRNNDDNEQKFPTQFDDTNNILNTFFSKLKKLFDQNEMETVTSDYGGFMNKNGFIEPDIDDYITEQPPLKRMKLFDEKPPVTNTIISTTVQTKNTSQDK